MDAAKSAGEGEIGSDRSGASGAGNASGDVGANATKRLVKLDVGLSGVYPAVSFDPAEMEAANGSRVNLTFRNTDLNPLGKHNWKIKGTDIETRVIPDGQEVAIEFDAPPVGVYSYICSVPQHEGFGMIGTLTILPA